MNATECPNDLCNNNHEHSDDCYECGVLTAKEISNRLIKALEEACRSRHTLIVNSDPDTPPTDPLTYDPHLQNWTAVLNDARSK